MQKGNIKRVLIFSTDDHLYPAGGAEQAMGNITKRLPHIEFDLICARLRKGVKSSEKLGNVTIHRMGFGVPRLDGFILALFGHLLALRLIKKQSYDLMWSIMASYGAFSAVRVKKKTGIPFLLTLQEGDSFDYIYNRVKHVRKYFDEIFRTADGIQAISNYLLQWGKKMGYIGQYGKVIPNGVAVEAFTKEFSVEEKVRTRESFGFPPKATILLTSSRLELKNGVGDVIAALGQLPENICFVVCGSGSLEEKIRLQVNELGLNSRVKFMGFVDPKDLPLLMKSADIFIRPSLTEGLGNAFLEAMAARMVVIGTPAGGIPDFLTDGKTGFMVDIENPTSIAATVTRILSLDTETKNNILDRAEAMVREKFNWEVVSKQMEEMFKEVTQHANSDHS
jgi:glycosyltransferase involved in cell wall biosynthesis